MQLPLGSGFYQSTSPVISNQECINWYPNYPQSSALSEQTLLPTPGLTLLTEAPTGVARGGIVFNGVPYWVIGSQLLRLDETIVDGEPVYDLVPLGEIAGDGRVSIAKNNTQICIVPPDQLVAYIYSESGGLELITDPDFQLEANVVVYIDGYFIFATDTQLFSSALNDGLSYNALDFATAEVDPDNIVTLIVYKNQLYVLGVDVTEVFQNVGNPEGFPLQRIEGFIIDKGCSGPFAVVEFEDSFVFVGSGFNERPAVWSVSASEPIKISTTAVDVALSKLSQAELESAITISYAQQGAYFAVFALGQMTLCFDSTASRTAGTPIWHERQSDEGPWRVNTILDAYGRLLVSDNLVQNIGALELDVYDEYGSNIERVWTSQPIAKEDLLRIFVRRIQVTVETGLGNDPQLGLSISEDGGLTYSNEIPRGLGEIGERDTLLIWDRLGSYTRYLQFRLRFVAPERCVVARMDANIL